MKAQSKRADKQDPRERQDTKNLCKALLEESHDLAVIAKRKEELTISFDESKKKVSRGYAIC